MNQQEYIQELISKARFLATFDVYKTSQRHDKRFTEENNENVRYNK